MRSVRLACNEIDRDLAHCRLTVELSAARSSEVSDVMRANNDERWT